MYDNVANWPRIGPAAYRTTTQEDGLRGETNTQVDGCLIPSLQVAESISRTLSRWRHGFKSRWDYQDKRTVASAVSTKRKVQTQIWDHRKGAGRDRRAGRAARPSSRICPAADGTTSPRAEIRAPGGPRLWTDMCCPRARCTRTTLAPESTARMATRVWVSRPQSRPHPHRSLFHMPSPHCNPASSSCLRRWVRRMRPARHYPTAASLTSDSSR